MKIVSFTVKRKENGKDLLSFLAEHLNISKKKAKMLLDSRNVFVNQRRIWMAKHALQEGLVVSVHIDEEKTNTGKVRIPVLLDEKQFMVINKPAGYLSNGGRNSIEDILRLRRHNPELRVIHRLDKETSGCLLVAKNYEAFEKFVEIFRNRELKKIYHAIVVGRFTVNSRKIQNDLKGEYAVTGFKVLDTNNNATHLKVKIDTGRTHQIRQHMAELYHPVIGDKKYGMKRKFDEKEAMVRRHMLHASDLVFKNPYTGDMVRVKSTLPADFKRCLASFKLT